MCVCFLHNKNRSNIYSYTHKIINCFIWSPSFIWRVAYSSVYGLRTALEYYINPLSLSYIIIMLYVSIYLLFIQQQQHQFITTAASSERRMPHTHTHTLFFQPTRHYLLPQITPNQIFLRTTIRQRTAATADTKHGWLSTSSSANKCLGTHPSLTDQ